jgi:hypothetical protein
MAWTVHIYFLLKNSERKYFTDNYRDAWSYDLRDAHKFNSLDELKANIIKDRKERDEEYSGFDFFIEGEYLIENKVSIIEVDDEPENKNWRDRIK